jgi:hypothetical protein
MARHRSPCPRVRSRGCSFLQSHPLLQVAAKAQGCSAAWLAGANRALPVLAVARKEAEGRSEVGRNKANLGISDDAHGSLSGCQ